MIINDVRPQMETSTQLEEQFFSIQDQGMIFDILRNRMYSNPILAICREITCNARDAHREVGKADIPIHVYLPNTAEPFYKVKDFGPGISPDRMSNIFIKYTASTKRSDNLQTGGFGLGAKTPFSYSDSFNIVTNYNGIRYNYACFIDETKIGKLSLLSESPTTDCNGTEIIIPVQNKDFHIFSEYTEQVTRHWATKPITKPHDIIWKTVTPTMKGTNWSVVNSNSWNRGTKLIIDEIEYPVDANALRSGPEAKIIDCLRGDLYLYFGVGELSLSASREQIYLDDPTKKLISKRLQDFANDVSEITQEKINNAPNYFEANVYYRGSLQQTFSSLSFLNKLTWQSIPLITGHPDIGCTVVCFTKGKFSRRFGATTDRVSRSTHRSFNFTAGTDLYVNDLGIQDLNTRHVKKAFDNNSNLTTIQVVSPSKDTSVEALNTMYHLDKMQPKLLSTIVKPSSRSQKGPGSRLIVFKYDIKTHSFRQTSYSSIEEDTNNKVLCSLHKDSHTLVRDVWVNDDNLTKLEMSSLRDLASVYQDHSFYGLDDSIPQKRIDEDFGDFQSLNSFIKENILSQPRSAYIMSRYLSQCNDQIDEESLLKEPIFREKIKNSNSVFLQRLSLHQEIRSMSTERLKFSKLYQFLTSYISDEEVDAWAEANPHLNFAKVEDAFNKQYPLLSYINSTYNRREIKIEDICNYINLIDAASN